MLRDKSFAATALLLLCAIYMSSINGAMATRNLAKANTNTDVIVVGAGMSGISAARYLANKKVKSIVLEARSRIGGRINTWTFKDGSKVDLGAAWIHGTEGEGSTS